MPGARFLPALKPVEMRPKELLRPGGRFSNLHVKTTLPDAQDVRFPSGSRSADRVFAPVHGELERSAELSARGTDLDRPLGPAAGIVGGIDDRISAASRNIIEQYTSIGWFLFIRIFKTLALAPVQTLGSNVAVRDDLAPVQPAPMTKPRPEDPSDATMQTPSRLGKSSARPRVALALGFLAASVLARCSSAEKTTAGASGMVAAGSQHSVAIHPDGTLWAWGDNGNGQVGDSTTTRRSAPVQVGADRNWALVTTGWDHTLAVKTDGTLWAWGEDVFGQLGDGTTNTERLAPVQVGTDKNWALIAADERHSFAIKTDGTLWAWGSNGNFQLGDGTATDRSTPVQIGTDTHWAAVAAGDSHSLAIKTDGTLWAWGNNQFGQLGFPPTVVQTAPVQIGTDRNWTSVAAGGAHSMAIKTDGTLWAWGANEGGQLGDGTTTGRSSPVQVGTDRNWAFVSAGYSHTTAVKTDATLWAWGWNSFGQLGVGDWQNKKAPTQVGADTHWAWVDASLYHTVAVRRDGAVWTWGANLYGQLGNGGDNAVERSATDRHGYELEIHHYQRHSHGGAEEGRDALDLGLERLGPDRGRHDRAAVHARAGGIGHELGVSRSRRRIHAGGQDGRDALGLGLWPALRY